MVNDENDPTAEEPEDWSKPISLKDISIDTLKTLVYILGALTLAHLKTFFPGGSPAPLIEAIEWLGDLTIFLRMAKDLLHIVDKLIYRVVKSQTVVLIQTIYREKRERTDTGENSKPALFSHPSRRNHLHKQSGKPF